MSTILTKETCVPGVLIKLMNNNNIFFVSNHASDGKITYYNVAFKRVYQHYLDFPLWYLIC